MKTSVGTMLQNHFAINGLFTLVWIPRWTVAFPQRDRKFSIYALTQSTAEMQTAVSSVNQPLQILSKKKFYEHLDCADTCTMCKFVQVRH